MDYEDVVADLGDLPPPYAAHERPHVEHGPYSAIICQDFSRREMTWRRHVVDGQSREFCGTCNGPYRHPSRARPWFDRLLMDRPHLCKWLGYPQDRDEVIRLDPATSICWSHLRTAMLLGQRNPRRSSAQVRNGTTFSPNTPSCPFSHRIDSRLVYDRMLLKIQSYRTLDYMSVEELRGCLPTCVHCAGSVALAEQFADAFERFKRQERLATLVFRCYACPTEYITMVVPRAVCHLPDGLPLPERYYVDFDKDWMIIFCRWIDVGSIARVYSPARCRNWLDLAGKRKEALVGTPPLEVFQDRRKNPWPNCVLFDGQDIWPYSGAKPAVTPVAIERPTLAEVLRKVCPTPFWAG